MKIFKASRDNAKLRELEQFKSNMLISIMVLTKGIDIMVLTKGINNKNVNEDLIKKIFNLKFLTLIFYKPIQLIKFY